MQVPVQFEFQANQAFPSFFIGKNTEIITQLKGLAANGLEQQVYIWGDRGCGKSHLLQATCQHAQTKGKQPFYFRLNADDLPSPGLLEGLEEVELVCFDDIQALAGNPEWEQAMFGFYNSHRQNGHKLLLAADCPPKYLSFELPDLKTRMSWGLTLKILPLAEHQIIEALTFKAHSLGFDIPPNVGRFLLNHYVHDLPTLWVLLGKIDNATLIAKRKLTIPFLKQILTENYQHHV
jgi:DnaA family protein